MSLFKKNFIYVAIVLSILTGFSVLLGCMSIPEEESQYTYTESTNARIIEPLSYKTISTNRACSINMAGSTLVFWEDIEETERNSFSAKQQELFEYLSEKGAKVSQLTLYILRDKPNRSESENSSAYYDISSVGSYKQILTTLQAIYGDYINYGLLYAMSNDIAVEMGWRIDETTTDVPEEDIIAFLKDNSEYLSLTYPCFVLDYSDESSIAISKTLAKAMFAGMDKETLFTDNQELAFFDTIREYANNNELEYMDIPYLFAYNGTYCPLKIKTSYYEGFLTSVFNDAFSEIYDWVPFQNYRNTIKTLNVIQNEIEDVRNIFNVTDKGVVPIIFTESLRSNGKDAGGLYHDDNDYIEVIGTFAILHEYVHYLHDILGGFENKHVNDWHKQSIAFYYGDSSYFIRKYYLNLYTVLEPNSEDAKDFEQYMGRKYQNLDDYPYDIDIYVYLQNNYDLSYNAQRYSFGRYFAMSYGDNAFIQSMLNPENVVKITGKNMKEIQDEWKEYIIATYSVMDN